MTTDSGLIRYRPAEERDAAAVAALHAQSWRTYYRGSYSDHYLDGDILPDRLAFWADRLDGSDASGTSTTVAEDGGRLVGFVHVVLDTEPTWGSLIDNLHVASSHHRRGIGGRLLTHAASTVGLLAASSRFYLWVQERNVAAQRFYAAMGGRPVDTTLVTAPGGVASRLDGSPRKLRYAWTEISGSTGGSAEQAE